MHIVLFSHIPYHYLHQRPQKLADEFVERGHAVTYVEPSGWKDYRSGRTGGFGGAIARGLAYHLRAIGSSRKTRARGSEGRKSGLRIARIPLGIPLNKTSLRIVNSLNRRVCRNFLVREILETCGSDAIAIVEHPFWGAVLMEGDFLSTYYDCIDDFSVFMDRNSPEFYATAEMNLLRMASGVFVTARELQRRITSRSVSCPVIRVPNGVAPEWFRTQSTAIPPPVSLATIPHPRVGYVGCLGRWLDYPLLSRAMDLLPDVQFVFAGPVADAGGFAVLNSRRNFQWIGTIPYGEVPPLVRSMDACLIPFAGGDIARTTNPVKVYEYFSLGKPVITTPVAELEEFRANNLLWWADDTAGFAEGIRSALRGPDEQLSESRQRAADANSWASRVDTMLGVMTGRGGLHVTV